MLFTISQTSPFAAKWERLKLTDDDLRDLELALLANPKCGKVVSGTGGLRKLRFAAPSRNTGKSGAFRVGYVYYQVAEIVYLLAIIAKGDQANFTAAEKSAFRALIARLAKNPRGV